MMWCGVRANSQPCPTRRPPPAEPLAKLDFDTWRDIRFRPSAPSCRRPQPVPAADLPSGLPLHPARDDQPDPRGRAGADSHAANLFDYGRNRFERPLPVNTGFAGFRLHYPLNDPKVHDEIISFLGASYFRFLGQGQKYGILGARPVDRRRREGDGGVPGVREFWVEQPEPSADRAVIHCAARQREPDRRLPLRPLCGEGDSHRGDGDALRPQAGGATRHRAADLDVLHRLERTTGATSTTFRPELHDSDGLLMHTGAGEWILASLAQSDPIEASAFVRRQHPPASA